MDRIKIGLSKSQMRQINSLLAIWEGKPSPPPASVRILRKVLPYIDERLNILSITTDEALSVLSDFRNEKNIPSASPLTALMGYISEQLNGGHMDNKEQEPQANEGKEGGGEKGKTTRKRAPYGRLVQMPESLPKDLLAFKNRHNLSYADIARLMDNRVTSGFLNGLCLYKDVADKRIGVHNLNAIYQMMKSYEERFRKQTVKPYPPQVYQEGGGEGEEEEEEPVGKAEVQQGWPDDLWVAYETLNDSDKKLVHEIIRSLSRGSQAKGLIKRFAQVAAGGEMFSMK